MNRTIKTLVLSVTALSLVAFALAQPGQAQQNPNYKGTIAVQENLTPQQYQALAKVTLPEAVKAAQAALSTTAAPSKAELSEENGYLVWEVVIGDQEVKLDAGNAQVLHKEAVGAGEDKGDESGEEDGDDGK